MTAPARSILLGVGGHARVVAAAYTGEVIGCLSPNAPDAFWPQEIAWLGSDEMLDSYDPIDVSVLIGVGSVALPELRSNLFEMVLEKGFSLASVRHPAATVAEGVSIGEGAQIMAGAILQPGVCLGQNVLINTGAIVDHDTRIGNHVHIATGAVLSGTVSVGDRTHIGAGATVIQGIVIGTGAVIGAGAVVVSDVPDFTCVVGVPARPMSAGNRGAV